MSEEQMIETSSETPAPQPLLTVSSTPFERSDELTPQERANLAYQRQLARLQPGSPPFRQLKRSMRSTRIFNQPALYWPTGRALTENGGRRRSS